MKFICDPNSIQSMYLKGNIRENVLLSLEHVLYVCENVLDKDTHYKIKEIIVLYRKINFSSGFLFFIIKEISNAIEKKLMDRISYCFNLIPLLILENRKIFIANSENLSPELFDFYSNIKDDVYSFSCVDEYMESNSVIDKLENSFEIIKKYDDELYKEIFTIVDEFFIFKSNTVEGDVVYSGSDFNKLGTVFINYEILKKENYFIVDKIIHESAHQILLSIMTVDEVVLNSDNERYPSPLRKELRTMNGIYHAAFVLYRLSGFFYKIVKSNDEDKDAYLNLTKNLRQFKSCYKVIMEKGNLTNLGKSIIDKCNLYVEDILNENYRNS